MSIVADIDIRQGFMTLYVRGATEGGGRETRLVGGGVDYDDPDITWTLS